MNRRLLRLVLSGLLSLSLLVALGAWWLLTTEAGLRAAWAVAVPMARQLAGIEVQAGEISGTLLGPVQVWRFRYRDPWVDVQVSQARLNWQPAALLQARIHIEQVEADQARVALQDAVYADSGENDDSAVLIPVTIHIDQARIGTARFLPTESSTPWLAQPLTASVRVERDRVVVDSAGGRAYQADIQASGFIAWNPPYALALTAQTEQTLPGTERIRSQIQAEGELDAFSLQVVTAAPYPGSLDMQWRAQTDGYAITLQGAPEPAPMLVALGWLPPAALDSGPLEIEATGVLNATGLSASHLVLQHGDSRIEGQGRIDWQAQKPAWSGQVEWQALQLPPWEPLVSSEKGQAQFIGEALQWKADLEADFTVKDQQPGRLQLQTHAGPSAIEVSQGLIYAGRSRIELAGMVWPQADLQWSAKSPHLGELWPGAKGSLSGQGELAGQWPLLRVLGRLQANQVAFADFGANRFSIEADLDLAEDSRGYIRARGDTLNAGQAVIDDLQLALEGRRTNHQLAISWKAPGLSGSSQADGVWQSADAPWQLEVGNISLQLALDNTGRLSRWQLVEPAHIHLHRDQQSLDPACLGQGQARICLQGKRTGDDWQAMADMKQLPLALLSPWLPLGRAGLEVQGELNGRADIRGHLDRWQTLQATADSSASLSRDGMTDNLALGLHGLSVSASPAAWHAEMEGRIGENGRISLEAAAEPEGGAWQAARLRGDLRLDMPVLQELAVVAPEIEQLRGTLEGRISAGGTLGEPVLGGNLQLSEGRLDLRDYGISLSPLNATLSGRSDGSLRLETSAQSGGGKITANGQVQADWRQPSLKVDIRGERFLATRTEEATVYVSPDLALSVQNRNVELSGRIEIPEAQLRPQTRDTTAQTVSPDQVLVNGQHSETQSPRWNLMARVKLILGDKVFFNGLGVNTRLAGQLDLRESPGKLTVANGEIRLLEGSYETYGQKLSIETGRLIFANAPVTQPALDIRATRTPRPNITVGVRVRGLLNAPDVSLFSTPPMRQAEQLSYLVLGRPLAGNEGNPALAEAALAMGLKRGDRYIQGLGNTLGVDDIGIETTPNETGQQASLVVGKYLSPRLYVSYGAGLFEPLHRLRLRYRLSEHWTAVGESGTVQGADILYTIER